MADEESEQELLFKNLHIVQSMIDVSAERLEGLRTQCATTSGLTQNEIRTLEGKLIKLFAELLDTTSKLRTPFDEATPALVKWLKVVGLGPHSIEGICQKIASIEELQNRSDHELRTILNDRGARPEEIRRLCLALHNLKLYMDMSKKCGDNDDSDVPLSWDSWDPPTKTMGLSPRPGRSRAARASVPSEESIGAYSVNCRGGAMIPPSSSVSSINSLNAQCVLGPPLTPPPQNSRGKGKFPMTPPPKCKHLTGINNAVLLPDSYPLTKSKSHESQLAKGEKNGDIVSAEKISRRARLPTEPGPDTANDYRSSPTTLPSPIKSPPYNNTGTDSDDNSYKSATSLQVPKSPRTPTPVVRTMTHQINHRFKKKFKMMATCGYCAKPIFLEAGMMCKECKYTCHSTCEDKVAPSCGLPTELLNEFKKKLSYDGQQVFPSPTSVRVVNTPRNIINSLTRNRKRSHPQPSINIPQFPPPDSSSNTSSCNSSTPSSPAVISIPTPSHSKQQFHFPDIGGGGGQQEASSDVAVTTDGYAPNSQQQLGHVHHHHHHHHHHHQNNQTTTTPNDLIGSRADSDVTASISGSMDSDKTPVRVDSQDSQVSDTETITDGHRWPRQNSLSMREWDIPFDELKMGDVIGAGRFGLVYRGYWHCDVAVKVLNINYLEDEKTLEQFRTEVSTFRKTRHDNVILFMGACMQPPRLAIVTSFSKGMSLYTHIHLRKDKFNMNKTTIVAQQISQGMGYLHARGIVHKDLKSKNIFLENGKIVITDFGLFSMTKLCYGNRKNDSLWIPPGWLCYLAPEIIRKLHAHQLHAEELPFSKRSDIYAFGTVWFELLCGEWPFKSQPPEAIIWQLGKGLKPPLANLQASRDVKDILMLCWSFREQDRPDFTHLVNILEKLPKKRLARSPSHPIHLSRSAESVF